MFWTQYGTAVGVVMIGIAVLLMWQALISVLIQIYCMAGLKDSGKFSSVNFSVPWYLASFPPALGTTGVLVLVYT